MNKKLRKELVKLVDQYNLTVFQRARILFQAKNNYYSRQEIVGYDNILYLYMVEKDCLEVVKI